VPLLGRYVLHTAQREGWSVGRAITEVRQTREAALFRQGLGELQEAVDSGNIRNIDAAFHGLNAALAAWTLKFGVKVASRRINVTVSLPMFGASSEIALPRLRRRNTSEKMLVFIEHMLMSSPL
jgi:hypothetical protein